MARYLERLAARAGVLANQASASPRPRGIYENDALVDPFETTAPWAPDSPAEAPAWSFEPLRRPEFAEPRPIVPQTASAVPMQPRPSEVRLERHTVERVLSAPEGTPAASAPPTPTRAAPAPQMELHPAARRIEREIRSETVRLEGIREREVTFRESTREVLTAENAGSDAADIERNVLRKVLPALDAWFGSANDGLKEAPRSAAAGVPLAPSRMLEAASATSPVAETPQLVIGSIRVDVGAPPTGAPLAEPRTRIVRTASMAPREAPPRLGFGLGQM